MGLLSDGFLGYLRAFRFTGDVRGIPEGEVFFPLEPLVEVSGPRIEAQIVETFLLNTLNFQVMVASKDARAVLAARGRPGPRAPRTSPGARVPPTCWPGCSTVSP